MSFANCAASVACCAVSCASCAQTRGIGAMLWGLAKDSLKYVCAASECSEETTNGACRLTSLAPFTTFLSISIDRHSRGMLESGHGYVKYLCQINMLTK